MRERKRIGRVLSAHLAGRIFYIEAVKPLIQLKHIQKTYPGNKGSEGVKAVSDVNLHVRQGEIFGIIGRSGAGKSTLLRLVNGLETPTSGEIWVKGREISSLTESELRIARQKIGMIFQHFNLLWSRTVRENVSFPLEVAGKPKKEIREKVDALLERVGLKERAEAYPSQLSGGQKQRVGIARALANDPDVLLCDEATSALDPETTASILDLLKEINRDTGITLLLITHEMSVVRSICDQVAVMNQGSMIESGKVADLFRHPAHPITREFVSQLMIQEVEMEKGRIIQCPIGSLSDAWQRLKTFENLSVQILSGDSGMSDQVDLHLSGEKDQIDEAMKALKVQGVDVEVAMNV